tara:strand:+ start:778 stop:1119 length:342 start_codon:yes stop_codon:yes gene_type:complete
MKILKNPYILVGLFGLGYFWYKRKQILKSNPKAKKPILEVEDTEAFTEEPKMIKVGKRFVDDVRKMKTQTIQRTIATNKKMLKRARVSTERRKKIKSMLEFLQDEYDYRISRK